MKTLYLIRHAKSSWDDPSLPDFERPLNNRGKRDAPFMAKTMAATLKKPDIMISSPARRALATARAFFDAFLMDQDAFMTDERLYHPSVENILSVIHEIDEELAIAAVFGHNPGFTSFANQVGGAHIMNIPTTGVVIINSIAEFWSNFEDEKIVTTGFHYPKQYL